MGFLNAEGSFFFTFSANVVLILILKSNVTLPLTICDCLTVNLFFKQITFFLIQAAFLIFVFS